MTPEGKVKAAVKKRLKELGIYNFWPVQTGYGASTLDCLGCYNGMFFGLETKKPGAKMTPRQNIVAAQIRNARGFVLVIDNEEAAKNLFSEDYR